MPRVILKCAAQNCTGNSLEPDIIMTAFPNRDRQPDRHVLWRDTVKVPEDEKTKRLFLCSRHFEKHQFRPNGLIYGANPVPYETGETAESSIFIVEEIFSTPSPDLPKSRHVTSTMESPRVLSIQSHVVHGYVGNKSATFPLQVLGFEVDAINSVQFSNHTGYKVFKGQILNENDLSVLIDSLLENGLLKYTHLLTGYVGSPSFLNKIALVVKQLREENPNITYVCDPVMGDNGKMYVPESLLPIYRDVILPLADVITPNQYEVELLSGQKINSIPDAWKAMDSFHEKGCKIIIMSSSELGTDKELIALASSTIDGEKKRVMVKIPKLEASFTGTGDLFASLFLAWSHKTKNDLKVSLENTIASLQSVLQRTLDHAKELSKGERPSVGQLELKIIQSKNDIENPKPNSSAVLLLN